ncbi:hypothetical protein A3B84_00615 [Candidatus Nomurabacteria bacterium RIFCSPHIGHO2_02_FULL_35_13]|uniref:DUF5652 domain-containing protein n=1 Tax=Candidatus Nomurabacteria bacterium RIFCSPHIGHO2_02_FULL_35_13 TaxID=1801748 RepID=A0A1F6VP55_9BACT|nr:MAG: hypothetical protein A3B84_00615 [Candidatus Nomurabacteria bacterium RIFCSPHIGHO2_02_FULL_35_13]
MNQLNPFLISNSWVFIPFLLWVLFWKGCSLWIAAKNHKKIWFLALLVLNTGGILEIVYIFFVAKKKWSDIKEIFSKPLS